jgi:hypothetical protein
MSISWSFSGARAVAVRVTESELIVTLADGRSISTPIAWFPRLQDATPEQRENCEISASGEGLHWPDVDEDLSVEGLLRGIRPRPVV